jgi:non-specific serine/threonine protein kinase
VPEVDSLLELIRDAQPHLVIAGPQTEDWLSRLEERHDDLNALVERLLATDPAAAAEACAALWPFWWQRGHMHEGRELLERAAAHHRGKTAPLLKGLGTIAFRQGDLGVAEQAFTERLELVEASGSQADVANACADVARVALRRGDFVAVRRWAERGIQAANAVDDPAAIRQPLHLRAAAARMEGRYGEAREDYLRSIELNERLGSGLMVAAENHNLVHVALHSGDRQEAERRFRAASEWIFVSDNSYMRPYAFLDAGILALGAGDAERACRLVACAQRIFEEAGSIPDPDDHVELEAAVAELRKKLGDRFEDFWAQGRALTTHDAQALAQVTGREDARSL